MGQNLISRGVLTGMMSSVVFTLIALPVLAEEYRIGDLVVHDPIARETATTAMTGVGYFSVSNTGDLPDTLLAVEADFPRVMIHDTVIQDDVATMTHLMQLDIPPGTTVTLLPGGKHVMFMGLNGDPFEEGETIPASLVFEKAGRLAISFLVVDSDEALAGQ